MSVAAKALGLLIDKTISADNVKDKNLFDIFSIQKSPIFKYLVIFNLKSCKFSYNSRLNINLYSHNSIKILISKHDN
ncbi:hypothetical protein SDC9_96978 [bioreactor metagenome]|uniref:Uncharacterized protein n=1 Tax=bioreactor metagenome TaxID=1076179 RepID=A0A645AAM9_9ZZZZ